MPLNGHHVDPQQLAEALTASIQDAVRKAGGRTEIVPPHHRIPFHWPRHPISADFHVLTSDWTGEASFESHGEIFPVQVAKTPYGVFGRCLPLWAEARGDDEAKMLSALKNECQPLFQRQMAIAQTLGREGRFTGIIRDLSPLELLQLFFCPDRDVAHEAQVVVETHASLQIFSEALISILEDVQHPHRRSAQWCVLDLFEDLPSFCPEPAQQSRAIQAIRSLIWGATDDYARTIYKAGVVLGGHISTPEAGDALVECFSAPSRFGRRAAYHAAFHLAEWLPERRESIAEAMRTAARQDPEPKLREYALRMADDIEQDASDHVMEPVFDEEG